MKITKIIDSAGKSLNIPIDDNDQTASLTISGVFSGILQIVGQVSLDGREIELTPYNPDGTVGNLESDLPLDLFLDVGGYNKVRVIGVMVNSGAALVTAITSSATRLKLNSSPGTGSDVNVTNFPPVQVVSGPLTNTQLRASPVPISNFDLPPGASTEVTLGKLLNQSIGIDSLGNPLPPNFDYYASTFTYNVDLVQTEYKVINSNTYTRTYLYDSSNNVTGISQWVKS